MAESDALIPVFMPPLAMILGIAERKKGDELTEAEVLGIRDELSCIMMEPSDAERMAASRGFIDVNPENCFADWHRLRSQMIGYYLPSIILCLPGGPEFRQRVEPILMRERVEHEFRPHEPTLINAFRASSTVWPTFSADEFARIEQHSTVLYVVSENYVPAVAGENGRRFLKLGRELLDAGGYGIKCDSSGISHSRARWTQFDDRADRNNDEKWMALFQAFVTYPIGSASSLYTCGMHLLGNPDLIVAPSVIHANTGQPPTESAVHLFRTFALYLLTECKPGQFVSGHTFSTDRDAPRYRVKWEACTGYPEDSFFFNPFGRWRFEIA